MQRLLKNNSTFLLPYLVLLLSSVVVLIVIPKASIHLWINRFHTGFFDEFFRKITFIGNGLFSVFIGLILLFFSLRSSAYILSTYAVTGIAAQTLKRLVFWNVVRPVKYFQGKASLHLVKGVHMLGSHSFPSGHSTTAFALFLGLAILSKNRTVKIVCLILALLVAFSRVYLSQHFLADIVGGSLIGTLGTILLYPAFFGNDRKWHTWKLQNLFFHE